MKNIHILPTDKPSRLWIWMDELRLGNLTSPSKLLTISNQNLYITSNEKFVRDEYITDGIEVIKATPKLVNAQGLVNRRDWKKIILTTDIDLIKDGVQAIDDEFLEWFVNNPSCEFINVLNSIYKVDSFNWKTGHKIMFPKESDGNLTIKPITKQHLIDMMKSDEELGLYDEKIEDIELEEVRGSSHCQFSVVENKLAIIYRNQLKILQAIKMLSNETK